MIFRKMKLKINLASYWIEKLLHDVATNAGDISENAGKIAHNTDNLQEYFKDTMNFDAVRLIEDAGFYSPIICFLCPPLLEGPLVVGINGNEGYVCDTNGTVDQHTADLLCQKAGFAGAVNFTTHGE